MTSRAHHRRVHERPVLPPPRHRQQHAPTLRPGAPEVTSRPLAGVRRTAGASAFFRAGARPCTIVCLMGGESNDRGELLLVWKLDGARFSKHGIDLRDLSALYALRRILVSTATHLWTQELPQAPGDAYAGVRLMFYEVEQKCAQVPIYYVRTVKRDANEPTGQMALPGATEEDLPLKFLRRSVAITADNTKSYARKESAPHKVPSDISVQYSDLIATLEADEFAEVLVPASAKDARPKDAPPLPVVNGVTVEPILVVHAEERQAIADTASFEKRERELPPEPEDTPEEPETAAPTELRDPQCTIQRRLLDFTSRTRSAIIWLDGRRVRINRFPKEFAHEFAHAYANSETHELRVTGDPIRSAATGKLLRIDEVVAAKSMLVAAEQRSIFDLVTQPQTGEHRIKSKVTVSRATALTSDQRVAISDSQSATIAATGDIPMSEPVSVVQARDYLTSAPGSTTIPELLTTGRVAEARRKVEAMALTGQDVSGWSTVLAEPRVAHVAADGRGDLASNAQWLREHQVEYRGQWVALREGKLLAAHPRRGELIAILEKSDNLDGALLVKVGL